MNKFILSALAALSLTACSSSDLFECTDERLVNYVFDLHELDNSTGDALVSQTRSFDVEQNSKYKACNIMVPIKGRKEFLEFYVEQNVTSEGGEVWVTSFPTTQTQEIITMSQWLNLINGQFN